MSEFDLTQLNQRLEHWGHQAVNDFGAASVYLFGSLIHKGGRQFGDSSDIDLVVVIPESADALSRHRWLEGLAQHKEALELELFRLLRRSGAEPAASIVAVTNADLRFDVHKDGHQEFFTANTFRNLVTGVTGLGIPDAGAQRANRFIASSLAFTEKVRNDYLAVSANGSARLTEYLGPDPLPKWLMRAAAMAARAAGATADVGAEHDVQEGLDALTNLLYTIRDKAPAYAALQDLVSVRRGARGRYRPLDPTHQLLLAELVYDLALSGGPDDGLISAVPKQSANPRGPEGNGQPKGAPDADWGAAAEDNGASAEQTEAVGAQTGQRFEELASERRAANPFPSTTALFAERFGAAFPGARSIAWFTDKEEIAVRMLSLLKPPLVFSDGIPIWWWRGGNLHIERFERLDDGVFLMNYEELRIAKVAAVPGRSYHRNLVYVETEAAEPTGLYPQRAEDSAQYIRETGYDYEEYGLLPDGSYISRAEYDDGHAFRDGKIVDVRATAELRVRYISPYNLIIAANGSPVNNPDFDNDLETLLNAALQGGAEEIIDQLYERVHSLPLRSVYNA